MKHVAAIFAALAIVACAKPHRFVAHGEVLAPPPPTHKPPVARPFTPPAVLFAFDSDTVKAGSIRNFTRLCASLADRPVDVTGYASDERSGKYRKSASVAYNRLLSTARANATAFHLRAAGCNVRNVLGAGETRQFGELGRNRRVVIEVVP